MRFDTATLALTLTALSALIPTAAGGFIPRRSRVPRTASAIAAAEAEDNIRRHNFQDGSAHDVAARALLDRATPSHKRVPVVPGIGDNNQIDADYTVDVKVRAAQLVDADPTYEISYLSKNDDEIVGYDEEHPDGKLRRSNPHEASCFDVPTFALNGILGMYPPDGRCTHMRSGKRTVAITCYHHPEVGKGRGKRSADDMHEERRLKFLENCDLQSRPEMLVS